MNRRILFWLLILLVVLGVLLLVDFDSLFGSERFESVTGEVQVDLDNNILQGNENVVIEENEIPAFIVE